nr:MAG TPA: hypothetical protein [Inoviridae sp.]
MHIIAKFAHLEPNQPPKNPETVGTQRYTGVLGLGQMFL